LISEARPIDCDVTSLGHGSRLNEENQNENDNDTLH
jgi:hypothetical protein